MKANSADLIPASGARGHTGPASGTASAYAGPASETAPDHAGPAGSGLAGTGSAQAAQHRQPGMARRLARPATGLIAVVLFQVLFASVFLGVLHRPALHHAPVAVVGSSALASAVGRGSDGGVRLVHEPTVQAAQAAMRAGQAYAAIVPGQRGDTLLLRTAASPGTANVLAKELAAVAVATRTPLQLRDLAPLPPTDPSGVSAYFLVAGWVLGGYAGATVLGMTTGGVRSRRVRQAATRLGALAGYAVVSGAAGALIFGPALGVMSGFSVGLAGIGALVVFASAAATSGLQCALGMPGTLIAVIGMVVFGNSTAGQSIATPLLASPWNVIGVLLPPSAGLSSARSVVYLGGVNLTGPLLHEPHVPDTGHLRADETIGRLVDLAVRGLGP
jgi:hypothetical protein